MWGLSDLLYVWRLCDLYVCGGCMTCMYIGVVRLVVCMWGLCDLYVCGGCVTCMYVGVV